MLLGLIRAMNLPVYGVCDPALASSATKEWRGVPVLGGDEAVAALDPSSVLLVNAVGQRVGASAREEIYERMKARGFRFATLVHPHTFVDSTATLAEGVQVMAGAVVQADASIGPNSIINTMASVDHDCFLGAHVHIAPGAVLCGAVSVHDRAFVAAGATVIQGITIGHRAIVGAGTILVRNLSDGTLVLGARPRPRRVR